MKNRISGICLIILLMGGNLFAFVEWEEKYQITNEDATTGAEYYQYTTREDISFYIMHSSTTADITLYRYACGVNADDATAWTNRASLDYYTPQDCWKGNNLIENQ